MQLPDRVRAALSAPPLRVAVALGAAFLWFAFIIANEQGRNPVVAVVYGVPAVLVFVWWRSRPWVGLGLALGALVLVMFGAVLGTAVNSGALAALLTGWFAVLGASLSDDQRQRWAGAAFAGIDAMLAVAGGLAAVLLVGFCGAVTVGAAWGWRQLRQTGRLRTRLAETTQRVDTAERDARLEIERNRIAREVHDVVAHSLAVVIAQADGARFAAETNPATVGPALEAIGDTARRALGEVRTMLHDLKASGGGVAPGAADIAVLVDGVRDLGVDVDETTFGEPRRMETEQGLALYRVAQEALTNAMRHGEAGQPVGFEIDWGDRQVVLAVTNTVPSTADPATERAGHGIDGMRERAIEAGGDCTAGVGSNGRFRVRVALPVAAHEVARPDSDAPPNPLIALFSSEPVERRA